MYKMKSLFSVGYARIGLETRHCFSFSNATWQESVQMKDLALRVSSVNGKAIVEKL